MSNQESNIQHVKCISGYTGKVIYGTVTHSTKCYITVTFKQYYTSGNDKIVKLFLRDGAMYNWENEYSYYLFTPEEIKFEETKTHDIEFNITQLKAVTLKTDNKTIYVVLSELGHFEIFSSHTKAFNVYSSLDCKVKGVYRVRGWLKQQVEIIGLNLSGGLHSNIQDSYLLNHKQKNLIGFKTC